MILDDTDTSQQNRLIVLAFVFYWNMIYNFAYVYPHGGEEELHPGGSAREVGVLIISMTRKAMMLED